MTRFRLGLRTKFSVLITVAFLLTILITVNHNEQVLTDLFAEKSRTTIEQTNQKLTLQINKLQETHFSLVQSHQFMFQTGEGSEQSDEFLDDQGVEWYLKLNNNQEFDVLRGPLSVKSDSVLQTGLLQSVLTTQKTSEPESFVYCKNDCWLLTSVLSGERFDQSFVVGNSMIDVMQNDLLGSDLNRLVAIIKPDLNNEDPSLNSAHYIPSKKAYLWASKDIHQHRDLIQHAFGEQAPMIEYQGHYFLLNSLSLPLSVFGDGLELYLLQNVTKNVEALNDLNRSHALNALFIWGLVELLILFVFSVYLRRLRTVIELLPDIIKGQFSHVKEGLNRRRIMFRDEFDDLENILAEVNQNYEKMHKSNQDYVANLEWQNHHHPMSKLPNKKALIDYVDQHPSSHDYFLLTDILRFDTINNAMGMSVGDDLIKKVSTDLVFFKLKHHRVFHLWGASFIILVPSHEREQIEKVCEQYVDALSGTLALPNGGDVHYQLKIACYPKIDGDMDFQGIMQELRSLVDKGRSSHQSVLYSKDGVSYLNQLKNENEVVQKVIRALQEDRFKICFQPILDVDLQAVSHYEVLCRIQMDTGEVIFPDTFISLAEKHFLIVALDKAILAKALLTLSQHKATYPELRLSVNASTQSIQEHGFCDYVAEQLYKQGIKPEKLTLEITEYSVIDDDEAVSMNLKRLHQLGVTIALDDFGTGYTSISYLRSMPLTYVKLDGSYIKGVLDSTESKRHVQDLITLIQGFGYKCIAEYVENQEVMDFLVSLNVEKLQGWYIGKPMPELQPERILFESHT